MSPIPADQEASVWYTLQFTAPVEWEELISTWLIELTGRGVSSQRRATAVEITAYCPTPAEAEVVTADLNSRWQDFCAQNDLDHPLEFRSQCIRAEDWATAWKQHYHSFRVGRRFVVKPSWEQWPPPHNPEAARPEDLIIELDPQMAFGTGTHATTQLCLEALERHLAPGETVADLGCGSGILSIGAALLEAARVEGWEIDPLAVPVAEENFKRNQVSHLCQLHQGDARQHLDGEFDLIVANVHTKFLLELLPKLSTRLQLGGRAILSGTTESSAPAVLAALRRAGLELVGRFQRGEWLALVAAKL